MKVAGCVGAMLLVSATAFAHVGITPRESQLEATETYALYVPSEGGLTTAVVLEVPDGVTILSVSAPEGASHEEEKVGDRVVRVTWTVQIEAGASVDLSFVATNPSHGDAIVWKTHQRYADGETVDWVGARGSGEPAPVTTLVPAAR